MDLNSNRNFFLTILSTTFMNIDSPYKNIMKLQYINYQKVAFNILPR